MALIRKIALVVSVVFGGSLALAAAAIAAGGGGLGPGEYVFANTTAAAQFGVPDPLNQTPGFDVFVSRGLNSFQLENGVYIVSKIVDSGYLAVGKKKLTFSRQVAGK